ncbi:N-6 DNA methylase [Helicobacter sp. 11S02596-1]|uniref:N-6 DNA methylase n=1 Tax=Helicobacter sp. 11S02596-1 TaxID=1476194 RepID=UPI000BA5EFC4|nr:N-6 DNA methylase [Helicobacter sp. 11S02596-1]PAF41754.1 N-6 DNA methylase [Helicobacter sp. 11S02596-1]
MQLEVKFNKNGDIYSHIRGKWLVAKPEEIVRQNFVCKLVNDYGYELNQMAEELDFATGQRGGAQARADIAIYKSASDKIDQNNPFIIVECKADNIRIGANDYLQGELYARLSDAPFFVTHNSNETRFWKVIKEKAPGFRVEISNIPKNGDTDKDVENLLKSLVAFKEDEFAKLLDKCHNIIRNAEKYDPSKAFDEISKILFMKVFIERNAQKRKAKTNIFSLQYIEEEENNLSRPSNESALQAIFENTKKEFAKDQIFKENEKIELKETTIKRIIKELEIYNLSLTSADIKGIAFEKFLGTTFRGELGQFFTPRSVVNFMVEVINPCENEVCCDPSSGSGGFLINIFNKVRHDIQKDIIKQYEKFKSDLLKGKDEESITNKQAKLLKDEYERLQKELDNDESSKNTRLYKLSNFFIYGTDANDRMARTSKMNMIMHGDGHGGIHHHDGLLNVNGIFENRFDVILTNPPFGSQVSKDDIIRPADSVMRYADDNELRYEPNEKIKPRDNYAEYVKEYYQRYGKETYQKAQLKVLENVGKPIASLFELKPNLTADKTEHLFINRCLDLLKPNGRLGIVLPETVLNSNETEYVRKFVEGRAFIRAVVSLGEATFKSSKANVKTSVLFIQKFSYADKAKWDNLLAKHTTDLYNDNASKIAELNAIIKYKAKKGEAVEFDKNAKAIAKKELVTLEKQISQQAWQRAKNDFDYPIFLAHAENTGITTTGETGDSVANDLVDSKEHIYNDKTGQYDEIIKEKGIGTLFKEFIKGYKIAWSNFYE